MNFTSASSLAVGFVVAIGAASCGGGTADVARSTLGDAGGAATDSGVAVEDTGTAPAETGEPGVCGVACNSNADCVAGCVPVAGALACCDLSTHSCYNAPSMCGAAPTDAGGGGRDTGGYP